MVVATKAADRRTIQVYLQQLQLLAIQHQLLAGNMCSTALLL
jgi:hypothetical protein